jgi:hypothetical protein
MRLAAALLAFLSPFAFAQTTAPTPAEPPPPPGIDEAGPDDAGTAAPKMTTLSGETQDANTVTLKESPPNGGERSDAVTLRDAVPDADEKVVPSQRAADADAPLPAKVRPADEAAPNVTIRQDENVTIEEYRREGQVYMVRVTPKNGPAYEYLDTDGDGRLEGDPKEGPMQPVYYTVYEWQ